jgi:alpha-L-rhamnosidase
MTMSAGSSVHLRIHDTVDGFTGTPTPRLTWRIATDDVDWTQVRAVIVTVRHGEERSFVQEGTRAHRVPWPDEPIAPREVVGVRVGVVGRLGGEPSWSDEVVVSSGVIEPREWRARFVGSDTDEPALVRKRFLVSRAVRRATMYVAAFGAVRVHINGERVGDHELAPGWTSYQWRVDADVYDVTGLVREGQNAIGVEVFGGWQTESYGFRDAARPFYPGPPRVAVQLALEFEDGSEEVVASDGTWAWMRGGTTASSLYRGETFDARTHPAGWSAVGAAVGSALGSPVTVGEDTIFPTARTAPPVRVTETRAPAEVAVRPDGTILLDFGQNLVGRLRIRVRADRGRRIALRHAEVLVDGELATRPLRNAASVDTYTAAGEGVEEWAPAGTFHGFRYADISGVEDGDLIDVVAEVLGTDLPRIGGFATSHAQLQRFHDNVVWGARGNFLSIPSDCPQRDERLGWTGDIQVFAPTAAFLFDCDAFLASWLRDVRSEQDAAGGVVPMVVPAVIPQVPGLFEPIAAWGDVITVLPSVLAETFGDLDVVRATYSGMVEWVEAVSKRAPGGIWADGKQFGDWLDPDAPPEHPGLAKADVDLIATAHLYRSAVLTADCAALLGRDDDVHRFTALASDVRAAFLDTYVTPRGRLMSDAPTAYAVAIVFGLIDDERLAAAGARLRHLVRRSGYCISTGFVGTPIVCEALSLTGHDDTAARLLLQTENPSWLYPVTMGATTIWERWDSLLEDGSLNPGQMTSFNHYALGAVADWMHRRIGGISPLEPAYARFRFAPVFLDGLTDAAVWHECPAGRIESWWRREDDVVQVGLTVPPNTRAVVILPGAGADAGADADVVEVGSGRHRWTVTAVAEDRPRVALDLDSPLTAVLDAPGGFDAVFGALRAWDPEEARALRRAIRWTPGRPLRDPLLKVPVPVQDVIRTRLADISHQPVR